MNKRSLIINQLKMGTCSSSVDRIKWSKSMRILHTRLSIAVPRYVCVSENVSRVQICPMSDDKSDNHYVIVLAEKDTEISSSDMYSYDLMNWLSETQLMCCVQFYDDNNKMLNSFNIKHNKFQVSSKFDNSNCYGSVRDSFVEYLIFLRNIAIKKKENASVSKSRSYPEQKKNVNNQNNHDIDNNLVFSWYVNDNCDNVVDCDNNDVDCDNDTCDNTSCD